MPILTKAPPSSNEIYGIIGVNYDKIDYNIDCNTDINYCKSLFLHTQSTNTHWGIKNKNDWVKITFNKALIYMTHYSLQASPNSYRAKGVLVEGIKENGISETIDKNDETGLTTAFGVLTKETSKAGPYKSIKFSVFDTYETNNEWYSSLFGIDLFGVLIPKTRYTCNIMRKHMFIKNIYFLLFLLI